MQNYSYQTKPSYEDYSPWYLATFSDDLEDEATESWYNMVTNAGGVEWKESAFWTRLQDSLSNWNDAYSFDHKDYDLLKLGDQPKDVGKKPFKSCMDKSFRWNVRENGNFPCPPQREPSTASGMDEDGIDIQHDERFWFNPRNWLQDFPDVFRVRFVALYFDGVKFLLDRIIRLAEETTNYQPGVRIHWPLEWLSRGPHHGFSRH